MDSLLKNIKGHRNEHAVEQESVAILLEEKGKSFLTGKIEDGRGRREGGML
jgi:hypothetical protein